LVSAFLSELPGWLRPVLIAAATVAAALVLHRIATWIAARALRRRPNRAGEIALNRLSRPSRWLSVAIALAAINPALGLSPEAAAAWRQAAGLATPALLGWCVIALLGMGSDILLARNDITVANNLRARQLRTRIGILHRVAVFVVLLVTICMMLITIPSIRNVGVTLIASAGLVGLAVGAAAQPVLKNLIAGIQLAFTEPIRIDDVVIVAGEWGRIEEIRLTYVVVKTWDERRLVVPISKFLEETFQNWTRQSSELLGTVFFQLDPTADIARLRACFEAQTRANRRWDGRVVVVQVTEIHPTHIEVRGLLSAADAGTLFDLRCEVREAVMRWLSEEMPEALPRRRGEIALEEQRPAPPSPKDGPPPSPKDLPRSEAGRQPA
jgi:small-conductance mechanosensitive channel